MATIIDFPSLSQAIQDWTHRSDLAPFTDQFVQWGENDIYRDILLNNYGQGTRSMEASLTGTLTNGTLVVPSDYIALLDMQVVDNGGGVNTVYLKDPQWIYDRYPMRQAQGLPKYVARDGANFVFGPYPDSGYSITGTYYQRAAALSQSNPVTWLVTLAPDLMLAASMKAVQPFLLDTEKTAAWESMYNAKLAGLIAYDTAEKWSAATMQVQIG